jgi:hypothetical protein
MLFQAVAILNDRRQARTVFQREDDADGLSHAPTIARFAVRLIGKPLHTFLDALFCNGRLSTRLHHP